MGKLEKLVVLAVLFTAALVLAISFNRGEDELEAAGPLKGARSILDREGAALEPAEGAGDPTMPSMDEAPLDALPVSEDAPSILVPGEGQEPSLLLNAGAEDESTSLAPESSSSTLALEPESDSTHRILMESAGMRPSFLAEFMMYTVVQGDTWSGLAQRFYRDGRYTRNLRLANEDLDQLTPGKDILVPVFDFLAVDAGLQSGAGMAPVAEPEADTQSDARPPAAAIGTPPVSGPKQNVKLVEYEVRSGDTLSDISLAVFGTATRWKEILEANRDKLQRPESLQVGMKLRIPEGGKLPPPAKKPEAKPKASEGSEKTVAVPKKKKVL